MPFLSASTANMVDDVSGSKNIDKICIGALIVAIVASCIFFYMGVQGHLVSNTTDTLYEDKLFDTDYVHQVDIVLDDKDAFFKNADSKEYWEAKVVIDGVNCGTVGVRVKGFASYQAIANRTDDVDEKYSLKIDFDRYFDENSYFGLDKLDLNNMALDHSKMRDFLSYQMMRDNGVPAPLCSYTQVSVNGENIGLYLAVEDVEDAFLKRNSLNGGELYKPQVTVEYSEWKNAFVVVSDDDLSARLSYIDDDIDSYDEIFDYARSKVDKEDKERLIQSLKSLSEQEDLEKVLNTQEVIDYFAVNNFVLPLDSYTGSIVRNFYLYEQDGKLEMIPWDYDSAFGDNNLDSIAYYASYPLDKPFGAKLEDRPMMSWIFSDSVFEEKYYDILVNIAEEVQSGEYYDLINQVNEMIRPYVEEDPQQVTTVALYDKSVNAIREFLKTRAAYVLNEVQKEDTALNTTNLEGNQSSLDTDTSSTVKSALNK